MHAAARRSREETRCGQRSKVVAEKRQCWSPVLLAEEGLLAECCDALGPNGDPCPWRSSSRSERLRLPASDEPPAAIICSVSEANSCAAASATRPAWSSRLTVEGQVVGDDGRPVWIRGLRIANPPVAGPQSRKRCTPGLEQFCGSASTPGVWCQFLVEAFWNTPTSGAGRVKQNTSFTGERPSPGTQ